MKPMALKARGYRSFADLDYEFVDGATAVVGGNGAGKSSLIGAVDFALFGPRGRSVEPYVREGGDELMVELTFEHAGDEYRVRRGWKGGRSTLDLERWKAYPEHSGDDTGPTWEPLTQGSAADTQAALERLIGMTRATFQASGYLAQRASDTFTGAQPRDRKKLLAEALDLGWWDGPRDELAADRKQLEQKIADGRARIAALDEQAQRYDALAADAEQLDAAVARASVDAEEALAAAEGHAGRAEDLEATERLWATRKAAVDVAAERNRAHLALLERTAAARAQRDQAQQELDALGEPADVAALGQAEHDLIDQQSRYDRALAEFDAAVTRRDGFAAMAQTAREHAAALRAKADGVLEGMHDEEHTGICETCGQTLGAEAAVTAVASYRAQAAEVDEKACQFDADAERVVVPSLPAPPDREALAAARAAIAAAHAHTTRRTQIETRIQALDATIAETDNDGYREQARELAYNLAEAERLLAEIIQPEPGAAAHAKALALQHKAQADTHAANARAAAERLAAVRALLEQAAAAKTDRDQAADLLAAAEAEHALVVELERACGRDGIPAWIVEAQAIPHIESEANRILQRLGAAITRVELRTERETKAGDKRDALDIVCVTAEGERALETFSGGEQARAEIALALGLVDVLAARRDADLRFLALDEPSGLDGQGTEALADVLRERSAGRVVLLASHDANLRDQFDQSVLVTRGPGGSQVAA